MAQSRQRRLCAATLDTALAGISDGIFDGIVTAPLHKGIINAARASTGFFSGHTEYLAEKAARGRS
ncbi:4-hydroxythreonine-4-phosphate dehydrogenase [Neisseria gonorrhoeae]|uniref:4-hydroxythreonine-4-phosphate dehydrogenase n=1 Tax=Neisseria gonorrhoeae TaxID=485 RepID=A0A379B0P3_NEIGO|nr:4-hydroxythreonine-4-phosphate dehydrogenase [Neisseria gonorrhoeae]